MKEQLPFVSIVTVNYNGKHFLEKCLNSLLALDYPKNKFEIIMVDNGSKDGSVSYVRNNFLSIKILKNKNNNYCLANNLGIKQACGEFVAILNNDTEVDRDWLKGLITVICSNKKIAAVGSKILFFDGKIQSVGHVEFPCHYWGDQGFFEEDTGQYNKLREVSSVSNCSALYRKSVFDKIGYFDEDFMMYMEDVDMAFRIKNKGLKIYYAPKSIVYHHLRGSGQDDNERKFYIEKNRLFFVAKHFPDKLSDIMFGTGEINRLKPVLFQRLLVELLRKLIILYGNAQANAIFSKISDAVSKIQIYGEHCLTEESVNKIKVLQNGITTKQLTLEEKESQIRGFLEKLAGLEKQSNNLTNELHLKNKNLSNQQSVILTKDQQLNSQEAVLAEKNNQLNELKMQLAVKDEQIVSFSKEAALKVEQLDSQQSVILTKDQQLNSQEAVLAEKNNQLNELKMQLAVKDEQIVSFSKEAALKVEQLDSQQSVILTKDQQLNSQEAVLAEKNNQLNELKMQLAVKDEQIVSFSKEAALKVEQLDSQQSVINEKENKINKLLTQISDVEAQLKYKVGEIKLGNEQLQEKNAIISQKIQEISDIYNSEAFKIFVRPLIWPFFSFVKKVKNVCKKSCLPLRITERLPKPKICPQNQDIKITQFIAATSNSKIGQDNEYLVKIFNKSFKEARGTLVIDIWPYLSPVHPQRHYAYFAADFFIPSRNSIEIKVKYDWENSAQIIVSGDKVETKLLWRGPVIPDDFYQIDAYLRDPENKIMDTLKILQKLSK